MIELLSFYDYDLNDIAKYSIDSIIYRCNANIVLHDLRNNWVDDAYLLMAKADASIHSIIFVFGGFIILSMSIINRVYRTKIAP